MSENALRYPRLDRIYRDFLDSEDSAAFIDAVTSHYTLGTLHRLFHGGAKATRRAAILAIGFLGDFAVNETLGAALSDDDRGVRLLAEHNIRQIWIRQGSFEEQRRLLTLENLNASESFDGVLDLATRMIEANSNLGEAWNQRAIAFSTIGDHQYSIEDCREALTCNRYHFPAAVGMGQSYLQLDDAFRALESFRLALDINPDLECLRIQVRNLERMLEGR